MDKRGHLQRLKQEFGSYTMKLPFLKDKRIHLRHTCLSIPYYNMTEQGSMTVRLSNLKQHDITRYKQLLGTKTC
jgi:hypothetical protein